MNENYEQMIAGLVTRTMRGQGFIGDITVTKVTQRRINGTIRHYADVKATKGMHWRMYRVTIGGKRGIVVKAVAPVQKAA